MSEQVVAVSVSVLFNEPKLLKRYAITLSRRLNTSFSALQRAEIAETNRSAVASLLAEGVSVLFNEPKLLKSAALASLWRGGGQVSVLFNEPKLLKSG